MRNYIFSLIVGLLVFSNSFTQQEGAFLEWVYQTKGFGSLLGQGIMDMVVDKEDNIYLLGVISDTVIFNFQDSTDIYGYAEGNTSTMWFLAKYSSQAELFWVLPFYDLKSDNCKMQIDDDYLRVIGYSGNETTIDFTPETNEGEVTVGEKSIFMATFSHDGEFVSAIPLCQGASIITIFYDMATCDSTQTLSICGTFQNNMNFDLRPDSSNILGENGASHNFVANYNYDGTLNWAKAIDVSNQTGSTRKFVDVTMDEKGNTFWVGPFRDTVFLDDFSENHPPFISHQPSSSLHDIFIVKYDALGKVAWQSQISAPLNKSIRARQLKINNRNLYFSMISEDSLFFNLSNDNGIEAEHVTSTPTMKHSIFKISLGSGHILNRFNFFEHQNLGVAEFVFDKNENIYITESISSFNSPIDMNPDPTKEYILEVQGSQNEYYLAKYDSIGTFKWAFNGLGSTNSISKGHHISILEDNSVVFSGELRGTVDVSGYSPPQTITTDDLPSLNPHSFIAKYSQGFLNTLEEGLSNNEILLFPNPSQHTNTLVFKNPASTKTRIDLYDIQGRLIQPVYQGIISEGMEIEVDISGLSSGMYLYRVTDNAMQQALKFIKE